MNFSHIFLFFTGNTTLEYLPMEMMNANKSTYNYIFGWIRRAQPMHECERDSVRVCAEVIESNIQCLLVNMKIAQISCAPYVSCLLFLMFFFLHLFLLLLLLLLLDFCAFMVAMCCAAAAACSILLTKMTNYAYAFRFLLHINIIWSMCSFWTEYGVYVSVDVLALRRRERSIKYTKHMFAIS